MQQRQEEVASKIQRIKAQLDQSVASASEKTKVLREAHVKDAENLIGQGILEKRLATYRSAITLLLPKARAKELSDSKELLPQTDLSAIRAELRHALVTVESTLANGSAVQNARKLYNDFVTECIEDQQPGELQKDLIKITQEVTAKKGVHQQPLPDGPSAIREIAASLESKLPGKSSRAAASGPHHRSVTSAFSPVMPTHRHSVAPFSRSATMHSVPVNGSSPSMLAARPARHSVFALTNKIAGLQSGTNPGMRMNAPGTNNSASRKTSVTAVRPNGKIHSTRNSISSTGNIADAIRKRTATQDASSNSVLTSSSSSLSSSLVSLSSGSSASSSSASLESPFVSATTTTMVVEHMSASAQAPEHLLEPHPSFDSPLQRDSVDESKDPQGDASSSEPPQAPHIDASVSKAVEGQYINAFLNPVGDSTHHNDRSSESKLEPHNNKSDAIHIAPCNEQEAEQVYYSWSSAVDKLIDELNENKNAKFTVEVLDEGYQKERAKMGAEIKARIEKIAKDKRDKNRILCSHKILTLVYALASINKLNLKPLHDAKFKYTQSDKPRNAASLGIKLFGLNSASKKLIIRVDEGVTKWQVPRPEKKSRKSKAKGM